MRFRSSGTREMVIFRAYADQLSRNLTSILQLLEVFQRIVSRLETKWRCPIQQSSFKPRIHLGISATFDLAGSTLCNEPYSKRACHPHSARGNRVCMIKWQSMTTAVQKILQTQYVFLPQPHPRLKPVLLFAKRPRCQFAHIHHRQESYNLTSQNGNFSAVSHLPKNIISQLYLIFLAKLSQAYPTFLKKTVISQLYPTILTTLSFPGFIRTFHHKCNYRTRCIRGCSTNTFVIH